MKRTAGSASKSTQNAYFLNKKINYLYDGAGTKVEKKVTNGSTVTVTDYLSGGFQYIKNGSAAVELQFFPHAEGYVSTTSNRGTSVYKYNFNYKDHLGNNRLTYTWNTITNAIAILEENNYYPFGLKHNNYNWDKSYYDAVESGAIVIVPVAALPYKYKYNGKEFQDELGLNMYDYGARNYDPAIGRWMNIDPKAEQSRRWSPYNYCYNNPVFFVDPDGMQAMAGDEWINTDGKQVYDPALNGGKGGYTKHATEQDKKFGEALRTSGESGAKAFEQLVTSPAEITVEFHNEETGTEGGMLGYTDPGTQDNGYTIENGNAVLQEAKIDIYVDTINKYVDDINSGKVQTSENATKYQNQTVDLIKNNNLTGFDLAVAIFGHEVGHTKNYNVYQQHIEKKGGSTGNINSNNEQLGSELSPQIAQVKILQAIIAKRK